MGMISDIDSPRKKGIVVLGGLAAALAVLGLGLAMLFSSRGDAPSRRETRQPREPREVPRASEPSVGQVSSYERITKTPTKIDRLDLAGAMDQSNARQMVRILKKAAATGNTSLKDSMLRALARAPVSSREIIDQELARTTDGAVRRALEEARARAR